MKKLTTFLFMCMLLLSLTACGGADAGADSGTPANAQTASDGSPAAEGGPESEPSAAAAGQTEQGETDPAEKAAEPAVTDAEKPAEASATDPEKPVEPSAADIEKPVEAAPAVTAQSAPPEAPDGNATEDPEIVEAPAPPPAKPEQEQPALQPEASPEPQAAQPEPPAEAEPSAAAATADTASAYIGQSVSSLIAALGEPGSRTYAPSCLGDGEDGELSYQGFTVYTYREDGTETVQAVE